MKRATITIAAVVLLALYLRTLVAFSEANPFQLIHFWKNHAFVVNQVEMARNALGDYHSAHGSYPTKWETAVDWWASENAIPMDQISKGKRGELVYWSNEQFYLLAWQDSTVKSSRMTIAYTPEGAFLDPNSLAVALIETDINMENKGEGLTER